MQSQTSCSNNHQGNVHQIKSTSEGNKLSSWNLDRGSRLWSSSHSARRRATSASMVVFIALKVLRGTACTGKPSSLIFKPSVQLSACCKIPSFHLLTPQSCQLPWAYAGSVENFFCKPHHLTWTRFVDTPSVCYPCCKCTCFIHLG